uniref:Hydrogenase maturation protease HycI n=1 Tax=uncultured organism TaxID=155900 RepID=M1QAL8_9ZZZZ|nr:hydrogenase maturation protease HycI [uncultured organism]
MPKKLLLGAGNDIRGDDGVGEFVAREFEDEDWEVIDCGTMPENYITKVDREDFDLVLIVDAAQMGLEPGEIRKVPRDRLGIFTMSTHAMPLSLLMDYVEKRVEELFLIGIQPKDMGLKEGLTPPLKEAKERMLQLLHSGGWRDIPWLEKSG